MAQKNYWKDCILPAREEMLDEIKKAVESFKGKRIELGMSDYGNCPILAYGRDDEDTYTLDTIRFNDNGLLLFDGSSSWENDTWSEDNICTDNLVEIYEDLEDIVIHYKDYEEDLITEGSNRYVFNVRGDFDQVVYGDTYEDAKEKWDDGFFVEEEHDEDYYGKAYYDEQKKMCAKE